MNKYQVVIQVNADEEKIHKATLGQIRNILKSGESIEIELVAHGGAGKLLLADSDLINVIDDLQQKGVKFLMCRNTLDSKGWTEKDFPQWVTVVDSAVVYIIKRQQEGWAYLRN